MLKLVFMGSDAIALPALTALAASGAARFCAVFTQPDRAAGRGQKVQPNAIKLWANDRHLPVHQPERMGPEDVARLRGYSADLVLVMAYGHILKPDVIGAARLGTLNLHTSLLPKYRGASPIQTAVAAGERETGVTLMRIVPELDAGPIADVEKIAIDPLDTAADVEAGLSRACVPLVARALPRLADGSQVFHEQNHGAATFCRRLDKADGVLDFLAPAHELAARINGLHPWPACRTAINGQSVILGLADAPPRPDQSNPIGYLGMEPGTVVGQESEGLLVKTGQGVLRLRRLQRPGGKMLAGGDFLRGFPVAAGTRLASQPMPALVSNRPFPRPAPK